MDFKVLVHFPFKFPCHLDVLNSSFNIVEIVYHLGQGHHKKTWDIVMEFVVLREHVYLVGIFQQLVKSFQKLFLVIEIGYVRIINLWDGTVVTENIIYSF